MSETDPAFETQTQIAVFGAERMALLEGHEATAESSQQLLRALGALAHESAYANERGMYCRSFQRAIGRPLVAQLNPEAVARYGAAEEDIALATIYGLKNEDVRVLLPRTGLRPGVYELYETMYFDTDKQTKIYKRMTPIYGNRFRNWAADRATVMSARKVASEDELQEALDIVLSAVRYDDALKASVSPTSIFSTK